MKKLVLAASMGAAIFSLPFASHAEESASRFFANGGVGYTHADVRGLTGKSDAGYDINMGYRWNDMLGIEAGYVDLGRFRADYGSYAYPDTFRVYTSGWTLGVNGKFDFAKHWYATVRGGLFMSKTRVRHVQSWQSLSQSDTNGYAGVGIGFNVNRNVGIGINFDRYYVNADRIFDGTASPYMFSANFEYRF